MKLYCDNKAGVYIANNHVYNERTKHIGVDCHFVKEKVESKKIVTPFIHSQD